MLFLGKWIRPHTGPNSGNNLFPVFVKLEELKLLIVGGGKIGLEKLQTVLQNSPATTISIVAPEIIPAIRDLAARSPQYPAAGTSLSSQ
jgi:siroheme synthase (precorrin-2 oxidase/ferrochelatase)